MTAWPSGRVMADHLSGLGGAQRSGLAVELTAEINALLGGSLQVCADQPAGWPGLRDRLAADLDATLDEPGRALVAAMACDQREPAAAFVEDLAEILFVRRPQRSEYRFNTLRSRPWRIERLMLEYATWARRLDAHQSALTKAYCARACDRLPVGCCSVLGYDLGLVPDRMLALQRLEALGAGWSPPEREDGCRYHTRSGCVLRLFKSPACIGFVCDRLAASLREAHGPAARAFIDGLDLFQRCDLDRERVFEQMRAAEQAGRALLTRGGQPEAAWA